MRFQCTAERTSRSAVACLRRSAAMRWRMDIEDWTVGVGGVRQNSVEILTKSWLFTASATPMKLALQCKHRTALARSCMTKSPKRRAKNRPQTFCRLQRRVLLAFGAFALRLRRSGVEVARQLPSENRCNHPSQSEVVQGAMVGAPSAAWTTTRAPESVTRISLRFGAAAPRPHAPP